MERYSDSLTRRLLTLVILVPMALAFLGCNDPMVSEMEGQLQESGFIIEQELQRYRIASKVASPAVSLPPAQAVDMEAERRELDKMVASGDWQSLFD